MLPDFLGEVSPESTIAVLGMLSLCSSELEGIHEGGCRVGVGPWGSSHGGNSQHRKWAERSAEHRARPVVLA